MFFCFSLKHQLSTVISVSAKPTVTLCSPRTLIAVTRTKYILLLARRPRVVKLSVVMCWAPGHKMHVTNRTLHCDSIHPFIVACALLPAKYFCSSLQHPVHRRRNQINSEGSLIRRIYVTVACAHLLLLFALCVSLLLSLCCFVICCCLRRFCVLSLCCAVTANSPPTTGPFQDHPHYTEETHVRVGCMCTFIAFALLRC